MPRSKRTRAEFEALSPDELPFQSRVWDFTLNNYTPEEEEAIQNSSEYRFCTYGKEVAPTTGTPHLQGMVVFKNARTRAGVLQVLGARISCRQLYSSVESLMTYCQKGGDMWEKGTRPVTPEECGLQGKARTVDILRLAKAGLFNELEEKYPEAWFYQQRSIMAARGHILVNNVSLDGVLDNYWIYGEPGVGKGMYVDTLSGSYYTKAADEKWWCGYNGQEDVLLDDLGEGILPLMGKFKLWTCRKPFQAEVKGGGWLIRPKRIFVTSQWHPKDIAKGSDVDAIMRRFQIIHLVSVDGLTIPQRHPRTNVDKPVFGPAVDVSGP